MKKLLAALSCVAFFVACQKSDSFMQPISHGKLVSVKRYSGGIIASADTFTYDVNANLLTQREWTYSNGTSNKDTFTLIFNYSGNYNTPVSYTIIDGWGTNTYTLSYDNQGRVIKDTMAADRSGRSCTFSYPNNNIAYTSTGNSSADTFFLANNNMVQSSQASIPFNASQYYVTNFSYSGNYLNPFYYTGQSANVRILLTKVDAWQNFVSDCISQQAFTATHDNQGGSISINYTTDPGTGKVIKAGAAGISMDFRYQ